MKSGGSASGVGRTGFVARHVAWSDEQRAAAAELPRRAQDLNVRTVRVCFVDQHGVLRGKSIAVELLDSVLQNGCSLTSTLLLKDTAHRTVYPVWQKGAGLDSAELTGASDFVMVPDPGTFKALPWAPGGAWMLADCYFQSGVPVPFSTRQLCQRVLADLRASGYRYLTGLELEFHVFKLLDPRLEPALCGQPSEPPQVRMLAHGYQYLTDNRFDELEPVLDQLRETLLRLGLPVRTMEAEMGPSQCELTFGTVEGLAGADNVVLARSAIKQSCRRLGLQATFMCRPALPNIASSGWHLHQSLLDARTGTNAFASQEGKEILSACGRRFLAGLLAHAREGCVFATPTINGYKRYRPYSLAPNKVVWGRDNRGAMLRVVGAPGDPTSHIENRIGEPAANPYLYFASQVVSGLDGIVRELEPPAAADAPYHADAHTLPSSLVEAIGELRASAFFRERFGGDFVDYLLTLKEFELRRFLAEEVTDWEQREYFELF